MNDILDRLEALAKAATPGPWNSNYIGTAYPDYRYVYKPERLREKGRWMVVASCHATLETSEPPYRDSPDAHFIAAFDPPTALKLLAVVRAAKIISDKTESQDWICMGEGCAGARIDLRSAIRALALPSIPGEKP